MFNYLLRYVILLSLFMVIAFIPAYGQSCCNAMTISVESTEGLGSLQGFSVKLDGRPIGVTDYWGYLSIQLSGISRGSHKIEATKDEDGFSFGGIGSINIPCINTSSGYECTCLVEVSQKRQR